MTGGVNWIKADFIRKTHMKESQKDKLLKSELAELNARLDESFPQSIERIGRGEQRITKNTSIYKGFGSIVDGGMLVEFESAVLEGVKYRISAENVIHYDQKFGKLTSYEDKERLHRMRYKLIAYQPKP
ncbi:MAG: hypothetical protein COB76_03880 [Alphaproteobacteria bacterium]|nr:MAG: hypothetical protein COB76_03880 [Alphaproteobacteria bacterium]